MVSRTPIQGALALFACLAAAPSLAVDPDNLNVITFQNRTGQDIRYIFLSPSDSQYWGTDILGSSRVLGSDQDLGFYVHYPDACNEFDIVAIGANEEAFVVYGYEICDGKEAEVRLTRRNLKEDAPAFEFATVEIVNETDYEIWYLFFSPGDANLWGVDQLDRETILDPGDSVRLLLPVTDEDVRYDVRAVDEDEDTYTVYGEVGPGEDEYLFSVVNGDLD